MKKILNILGVLTLAGTSVGTAKLTNNTEISVLNDLHDLQIEAPREVLLTTAGDYANRRQEWSYATINLGNLRSEQIVDIFSTKKDSYTEHKVRGYEYYTRSYDAGITNRGLQGIFHEGAVTSDWTYETAFEYSEWNFFSIAWSGWAYHNAWGTIKFQWYYNDADELLIDIVGTLYVGCHLSTVKGIASIKLGSLITIKYIE